MALAQTGNGLRTGDARREAGPKSSAIAVAARIGPAFAGYALPFAGVVYLGLKGGGYDLVIRSEVGVAVWWVVGLGAAVGVLPAIRLTRAGWVAAGLFAAFLLWTAVGLSWTESSERTMAEVGRVAALLGIFVLALLAQGTETLRRMVVGVGAAIAVLGALALLSRLHPQWFPADETAAALPEARSRLNYPLNYWNGLATLMAVGLPLLLVTGLQARRTLASALAIGAIPIVALAAFYTLSRGGAFEFAIALVAVVALYPRRIAALPSIATAAVASTILVIAATQRDALESGFTGQHAGPQADEMLALTLIVCGAAALVQAAIHLAAKHQLGPRIAVGPRASVAALAGGVAAAVVLGGIFGLPGKAADRWDEFKSLDSPTAASSAARYESTAGSGRYQLWQAAVDANASEPLTGIGPGTYEFWEAREGAIEPFVRDAHSLYLEGLAEQGIVGFLLIVGLVLVPLGVGARRALARGALERRGWVAAATSSCLVFAAAAAVDWAWELTILPVIFFILAAAILGLRHDHEPARGESWPRRGLTRALAVAAAVAGLVAIAIPLAGAVAVRDSQAHADAGQLEPALRDARSGSEIQPYAGSPALQQALVLELDGRFADAAAAAQRAADNEPTNWRNWLILSRIEARRGNVGASVEAYRTARDLNPHSPLFR